MPLVLVALVVLALSQRQGTRAPEAPAAPPVNARNEDPSAGTYAQNAARGAIAGAGVGSAVPVVGTGVGALLGAGLATVGTFVESNWDDFTEWWSS